MNCNLNQNKEFHNVQMFQIMEACYKECIKYLYYAIFLDTLKMSININCITFQYQTKI